jgi:hypothetical protein
MYQFSLADLLIAMLLLCLLLAVIFCARQCERRHDAIMHVLVNGGVVARDSQGQVTRVSFAGQHGGGGLAAPLAEDDLAMLLALGELRELNLTGRQVGDAAVAYLGRLRRLKVLKLTGTKFSDRGVAELRQALPDCAIEW